MPFSYLRETFVRAGAENEALEGAIASEPINRAVLYVVFDKSLKSRFSRLNAFVLVRQIADESGFFLFFYE